MNSIVEFPYYAHLLSALVGACISVVFVSAFYSMGAFKVP